MRAVLAVSLLLALASPAAGATTTINTTASPSFSPSEVTVAVDDTVKVHNQAQGLHNVDYDDAAPCPGSGGDSAAWDCSRTFTQPGEFSFHCDIHPFMTATVHVVQPPVTWDGGGGDGLWTTAANWSGDAVPGPGDDVSIQNATVTLAGTAQTVKSLAVSGSLVVNGVGLTVTGGGSIAADVTVTGGGSLVLGGAFSWTAGGISLAAGTLSVPGRLTIGFSASITQDGTGKLLIPAGGEVTSSGTLVGLPVNLENHGSLSVTGGRVTLSGAIPATNAAAPSDGAFTIGAQGRLRISAPFTVTGSVGGGGVLDLDTGDVTVTGTFTPAVIDIGSGNLVLNTNGTIQDFHDAGGGFAGIKGSGTLTVTGPASSLINSTSFTGTGRTVFNGPVSIGANDTTPSVIGSGYGVTVNGAVTWNPVDLTLDGHLVNASTWRLPNGSHIAGGGDLTITGGVLQDDGAIDVPTVLAAGTLFGSGHVASLTNSGGTVAPSEPGLHTTLTVTGAYTQAAGGTLAIDADTAADKLAAGSATLAGTLTVSGTVTLGTTFRVLQSASTPVGTFTAVNGAFDAAYDSSGVTVTRTSKPPAGGKPSIPASAVVGDRVTCEPGTWTNGPTFAYEWRRGNTVVSSEQAYTVAGADAGNVLVCRVTATNVDGGATADSGTMSVAAPAAASTATTTPTTTTVAPPATLPRLKATLPSAKGCVRKLRIRLATAAADARVLVNGRSKLRRSNLHAGAVLTLKRLPKKRFVVKLVLRSSDGRLASASRRYEPCSHT